LLSRPRGLRTPHTTRAMTAAQKITIMNIMAIHQPPPQSPMWSPSCAKATPLFAASAMLAATTAGIITPDLSCLPPFENLFPLYHHNIPFPAYLAEPTLSREMDDCSGSDREGEREFLLSPDTLSRFAAFQERHRL